MSGGGVAMRVVGMAVAVATLAVADPGLEVRVVSGGAERGTSIRIPTPAATRVEGPDDSIAFVSEIALRLEPFRLERDATIEVADALVSAVRVESDVDGAVLTIFVRRPVRFRTDRSDDGRLFEITVVPVVLEEAPVGLRHTTVTADDEQVAVDAESVSYDQATDTVIARGGVTLTRGEVAVQADEIRYDRRHEQAKARGRVTLLDPQLTLVGDAAEVDLDDETGWIVAARAEFEDSRYVVDAERVEKRGGPHYHVSDGIFTTCRCGGLERPSWSLACHETDVTLGSFGWVRGATFRVKDVPVLYVPYLAFPATTERQTGLLMPRIGYSNRRGFQYEQPFYWAIDKSSDLTLAVDVETEARVGGIAEYRRVWSEDAATVFAAAYFDESLRGGDVNTKTPEGVEPDAPENRFAFAGRHEQPAPLDSRFYIDLFAVSDDLFLREINNFSSTVEGDLRVRSARFTRSRAGLLRTGDRSLARLEALYYQDLIDPQGLALQSLPRLDLEHGLPLLGGRVLARVQGHVVDFQRDDGFDGIRADVAPELFVPLRLGRYLTGSVRGSVREQLYYLHGQRRVALVIPDDQDIRTRFRVAGPRRLARLDKTHGRESAEVETVLGTRLARTYDVARFGFDKLRHTVEPTVRFLYVPPVGRDTARFRLPTCASDDTLTPGVTCNGQLFSEGYLFDEEDAINRRTFLSYGITTRLFGRRLEPDAGSEAPVTPEAPHELLRAEVLHGWDATRDLTEGRQTSDLDLGLRFTPNRLVGLAYRGTLDVEEGDVLGQSVGLFLREPWTPPPGGVVGQAPSGVQIGYRFVDEDVNQGLGLPEARLFRNRNFGLEEVSGAAYLRVGRYMGLSYLARYDFADEDEGDKFLEQSVGWRLLSRCNCWVLDVGFTDRFDTDEELVRVQFTLVGLGAIGRRPSLKNYVGVGALTAIDESPDEDIEGPWR